MAGSAVSRKCTGSLLVRVSDGLAGKSGTTSPKPMPPWAIRLLPMTGVLRFIPGIAPTLMAAVMVVMPADVTLRFAVP